MKTNNKQNFTLIDFGYEFDCFLKVFFTGKIKAINQLNHVTKFSPFENKNDKSELM